MKKEAFEFAISKLKDDPDFAIGVLNDELIKPAENLAIQISYLLVKERNIAIVSLALASLVSATCQFADKEKQEQMLGEFINLIRFFLKKANEK